MQAAEEAGVRLIFFLPPSGKKRKGKKKGGTQYSGEGGCDVRAPVRVIDKRLPQKHRPKATNTMQQLELKRKRQTLRSTTFHLRPFAISC